MQPDAIVPEPGNPQALNRYAYVTNNPVRYTDPSGHVPPPGGAAWGPPRWDPAWVERFQAAHGGQYPSEQDWQDYWLSLRYPGTGPDGSWTEEDWRLYYGVRQLLGEDLLRQIHKGPTPGSKVNTIIGGSLQILYLLVAGESDLAFVQTTPDGASIFSGGPFPDDWVAGWTFGDLIFLRPGLESDPALQAHEYTHVLQYRAGDAFYLVRYLAHNLRVGYDANPYELVPNAVQILYEVHQKLPPIWEFPVVSRR